MADLYFVGFAKTLWRCKMNRIIFVIMAVATGIAINNFIVFPYIYGTTLDESIKTIIDQAIALLSVLATYFFIWYVEKIKQTP